MRSPAMSARRICGGLVLLASLAVSWRAGRLDAQAADTASVPGLTPGSRVLMDAHNAYPENGRHADRLRRALSVGVPLAIEQDLVWVRDPATGAGRSIVSHGEPVTGDEPSLDEYFFSAIRPVMERALRENQRASWPIVTLNLDFKTNEPAHHEAVWALLGRYEAWLTTARRLPDGGVAPLEAGPLLVLTGEADAQERTFYDRVDVGGRLRLFGAVHSRVVQPATPPDMRAPGGDGRPGVWPDARTNYRRWWNLPWEAVERGGQTRAGEWTPDDEQRLRNLVEAAHGARLWIRFYTLDGHDPTDIGGGWTPGYNFGSLAAAERRWEAAVRAGVDFVAVDQYEAFGRVLRRLRGEDQGAVILDGVVTGADHERIFERAFAVPPGTERLDISLEYDQGQRTVLDLGLRGPSGIRGWSGGGEQRVFVSSHSASFGYSTGPIEAGQWAVVLGVPNVRAGVKAEYRVTIVASPEARGWPTLRAGPGWYAGDLHTHSGHSDGRTTAGGARVPVPPAHVFAAAREAGLDFVALTDHNTAAHWVDVDRLQPLHPDLLLLHAREITTYRGHANAFGERALVDFRLAESRSMRGVLHDLTARGAVVSINHPMAPDDERCMGCGWNDRDRETIGAVQAIEVVNGGTAEGPMSGWPFWAELLSSGHRLTAVGGSDEHTPDDVSDGRLGRPTTVVYASELSEEAILDGIRAGRAYVRTRSAAGPVLDLWAESGARRVPMGGDVPPGELTLVAHLDGAREHTFEWIRNGTVLVSGEVPAGGWLRHPLVGRQGDWFSLVLRDAAGPTLFSSAIYTERAASSDDRRGR